MYKNNKVNGRSFGVPLRSVRRFGSWARAALVLSAIASGVSAHADTTVFASMLPNSRSVQVDADATLFATMINAGEETGTNCRIEPDQAIPGDFSFQTTDPATNALTGSPDQAVDLAPGAFQTFIVTLTPSEVIEPREVTLGFLCDNASAAGSIVGVNTFTFSASNVPAPDVIALGATPSADGVVELPVSTQVNVFSVASVNLGAGEELVISAELSDPTLAASVTICETDPVTSVCIKPSAPTIDGVSVQIDNEATPTFGVFVTSTGDVPFDPANNRIFVRFEDENGAVRGSTSVALRTEVIIPFTDNTIVGTSLWHDPTHEGRLPGIAAGFTFAANGTGVSYENTLGFRSGQAYQDISETFTWEIDSGLLKTTFDDFERNVVVGIFGDYSDLVTVYGLPQSVADFFTNLFANGEVGTELQLEREVLSRTAQILSDDAGLLTVANGTTERFTIDAELIANGWPDDLPEGTVQTRNATQTVYTPDAITNATGQVVAAGETWAVPFVFSPQDPEVVNQPAAYVVDALTFNAGGTTDTGRLSAESFSWINDGTTLVLTAGNEQHRIKTVAAAGPEKLALAEYFINGSVSLVSGQLIAQADDTGEALIGDLVNVDPITWQAGLNIWEAERYNGSQLLPEWVFGYQFLDLTEADRVTGHAAGDINCVAGSTDGCFTKEGAPLWDWSSKDNFITRSRQFDDTLRTRTWEILSYEPDGRAVVLESAVWKTGNNAPRFVIPPRINTLEELDLSEFPSELGNSPEFQP